MYCAMKYRNWLACVFTRDGPIEFHVLCTLFYMHHVVDILFAESFPVRYSDYTIDSTQRVKVGFEIVSNAEGMINNSLYTCGNEEVQHYTIPATCNSTITDSLREYEKFLFFYEARPTFSTPSNVSILVDRANPGSYQLLCWCRSKVIYVFLCS